MSDVLACFSRIAIDKIFREQSNILFSFSKRRNLYRKNLEPIKQITPEGSLGYRSIQISIRSGDDANVNLDGLGASDPFEFSFLKDSQERDLSVRGQFAYFVEENRASICQLKPAQALLSRPRKGALFMAEKLRSDKITGDCGTVHANEPSRSTI